MLPPKDRLNICFAHVAYQLQERFAPRQTGIKSFAVRTPEDFDRRVGEADVVVVSGLWRNELLDKAPRLRFIQSIGAGTDQFDRDKLKNRGIHLASAQGVNVNAVSEHVMALILAIARRLPEARDNQSKHVWRGMISELSQREDELSCKVLLVFGLGGIGSRLAKLAKAFGMRVIGTKRRPQKIDNVDEVLPAERTKDVLGQSDFVLLLLPGTPQTENFMNAERLGWMKPTAWMLNFGRGSIVKDADLIVAAKEKKIAGAVLDVFRQEPLPATDPLWTAENIIVLPHIGGPHPQRDRFVSRLFVDNLGRFLDDKPLKEVVDRAAGY
ncbi:MAG: D-2-hydroxyacid dehydrogenase [Bradyrhizobium sp.]